MKIRLKLTTPAGRSSLFEHEGPVVRIGRDPVCELCLEGEDAGKAASRMHARIELSPTAARLIDTASANKTLHNNNPVEQPVLLQPGDGIQIGFTGASLVVLDIELTAPAPSAPRRIEPRLLLAVGGGVAACAALICALCYWPRATKPVPAMDNGHNSAFAPGPADVPSGTPKSVGDDPAVPPKNTKGTGPPAKEATSAEQAPFLPSADVKAVGHYFQLKNARPSVLLQRAGANYPWAILRSGQAVSTAHSLVSLPGYESTISLDGGLRLNLWGSLPEFGARVLESAVMLNVPEKGVDLDLTLDRGRVEIDGAGLTRRAQVRLRFLREVWTVTLDEPGSKVCAELWQTPDGAPAGQARRCFGLFSRGKVSIKTPRKIHSLSTAARLAWSSEQPEQEYPTEELSTPPSWWNKPPKVNATTQDVLLSLGDWARKRFENSPDVIPKILNVVRDPRADPTDRLLGLWFLAALDDVGNLAEFLEDPDPNFAGVRNTAMYALRDWLARNSQRRESLTRLIQLRRGWSRDDTAAVVKLLAPFSEQARKDPATNEMLIGYLDHENRAVRHLAAQHLYSEMRQRMPQEALQIEYDPTDDPAKRQEAVAKWRKAMR